MSLQVKIFATIVDRRINFHGSMYELKPGDFARLIECKDNKENVQMIPVEVGEGTYSKTVYVEISLFTRYAHNRMVELPIPLINQPVSKEANESSEFHSSRFWAFKRYLFVTNRNYQATEEVEVKMRIHHLLLRNGDELQNIYHELKRAGIDYGLPHEY
jgi:hypothetical protein